MSARSFRSVGWVAGIAATALGCYMVNLKVASERASLEEVENRIVLAERDIRLLQTEIGTRGRLAQLEKWNVKVLALSAPAANQFLDGGFQLATLVAPRKVIDPAAPVVLASAPAPERKPVLTSDGAIEAAPAPAAPTQLLHTASLKREIAPMEPPQRRPAEPKPATQKLKPTVVAQASKPAGPKAAEPKPAKPKVTEVASAKPTTDPKLVKTAAAKTSAAKGSAAKPPASKSPAAKPKLASAKPAPKAKEVKAAR